ncbi:MAG: PaaI family thioesterase [Promethearchaeota archaeon]
MSEFNKEMSNEEKILHYHKLENAYYSSPNNVFFDPILKISEGRAEVRINILEKHYHFFGAAHGFLYFKALDDASFYSANSLEFQNILLTSNLNVYLTRPIKSGEMKAVGKVVNRTKSTFLAEALLYDSKNQIIGKGIGSFVKSQKKLSDTNYYKI